MNDKELHDKAHAAMYKIMKDTGIVSPVEVLMAMGILSKADYENWRFGKVPYLERVCKINLRKLSKINHKIRVFAKKNNLKPSWTFYKKWGNNKKGNEGSAIKLRFSKSGDEGIERQYATHYISLRTLEEAKESRQAKKNDEEANTPDC